MKHTSSIHKLKHTTRKSRRAKLSTLAIAVQIASMTALAGPEGGSVTGGQGSISTVANTTTIDQLSDRLAIDWQSYDVAADERVQYIQPTSSSIALNRVLSNTGSEILGQIDANGFVLLVNPNGVIFSESATINVGGILASGLDIDTDAFMNGDYVFSAIEGTEGRVVNAGLINAATGGSVSLLGRSVENEGLIVANLGRVNLAAGTEAVLTFDSAGLMGVRVSEEVLQSELGVDAAVMNSGDINAEGGQVLLTASTSEDIFSQAINIGNSAESAVIYEDGSFTLGNGANLINTGNIDVSSADNTISGQVVVLAENIDLSGDVVADGDVTAVAADSISLGSTGGVDSITATGSGNIALSAGESITLNGQVSTEDGAVVIGGIADDSSTTTIDETNELEMLTLNFDSDLGAVISSSGSGRVSMTADTIHAAVDTQISSAADLTLNGLITATDTFSLVGVAGNTNTLAVDSGVATSWSLLNNHFLQTGGSNVSFSGFESIMGGSGSDTLTGENVSSIWTINAENAGIYSNTNGSISFSGIENLVGGIAVDIFEINANIGDIDGGRQKDVFNFNVDATVGEVSGGLANDEFNIAAGVRVNGNVFGGGNNDAFNIDGTLTGNIEGENGSDDVTVSATGTVNGNINAGGVNLINDADEFFISGSVIGDISGGIGDDFMMISRGASVTGSLFGGSENDTFIVDSNVTESIYGDAGEDVFEVNGMTVSNLIGGDGDDHFELGGEVFGTITGDAGDDAFFIVAGNYDYLLSGGEGNDTLQLDHGLYSTWKLNGGYTDSVSWIAGANTYSTTFNGVESVIGSSAGNVFEISDLFNSFDSEEDFHSGLFYTEVQSLSGSESAADRVFADYYDIFQHNTWVLSSESSGTFIAGTSIEFSNIQSIENFGYARDTLIGVDQNSEWLVTQFNGGEYQFETGSTNTLSFSGIERLIGGDGDDSFVLGFATIDTIENGINGGGGINSLQGYDADNTWTVNGSSSGASSGYIIAESIVSDIPYIYFEGIHKLIGGEGADVLNWSGINQDIAVSVGELTPTTDNVNDLEISITDFEEVRGNDMDGTSAFRSLLIVNDASMTDSTTWNITDTNSGEVEGLNFEGFNTLWGDIETDVFNVGATITGGILGGGGNDAFNTTGTLLP